MREIDKMKMVETELGRIYDKMTDFKVNLAVGELLGVLILACHLCCNNRTM